MKEKNDPVITLSQIEEALEERENPDRRKEQKGLPEGVHSERRKGDRRRDKAPNTQ